MKKEGIIPTNPETCPPFSEALGAPVLVLPGREVLMQPSQDHLLTPQLPALREPKIELPEDYPFDLVVPNTEVFVSPKKQDDLSPLVNKALGLASKTSANVGEHYLRELAILQERLGSLAFSLEQLEAESHHLPGFEIHDTETARRVLNLAGYRKDRVRSDGVLLVFRLPQPSSDAWRQMTQASSPQEQRAVRKSIWTRLGYDAKTEFRENVDLYNKGRDIHLRRINRVGNHDPDKFYYLYEVTKPTKPGRQNRSRRVA